MLMTFAWLSTLTCLVTWKIMFIELVVPVVLERRELLCRSSLLKRMAAWQEIFWIF